MTISQAIEKLRDQQAKHGDIDVFFDCPSCGKSFGPDKVVTVAVHLTKDETGQSPQGARTV